MANPLGALLDTEGFVPRWECGDWTTLHGWAHILSDLAIFGAYAAIPMALIYFVSKRKDVPFLPIFWLFGAFILACGSTHLIEASLFWEPRYRLSAAVKVFTAVVSWATVIALIRILPRALRIPGMTKLLSTLEHEVAERGKVEMELRRAIDLETAILDAALDAIITIDENGTVLAWNPAAVRTFGYSVAEAKGKSIDQLIIPPELRDQHNAGLNRLRHGGEAVVLDRVLEMPSIRADGRRLTVELAIRRVNTVDAVRYTAFVRDITERKLSEERDRRSEERIRIVVEAAPNAMLMVDGQGKIKLVNSQTERLFGFRREELLDQPVEMLVPERYRAAHPDLRTGFFHAPAVRSMGAGRDLFGRRRDGSEVPIEIGLNPVQTEEGEFVLASIIDITERKQVELQRQEALAETETLLKEVHHRVKNNMQVVSSLLGLHAMKVRDTAQGEVLDDCRNRIRAMSLIHERLYTAGQFARIEFGEYLGDMVRNILASSVDAAARVRLILRMEPIEVNLDVAVPLSLIASELVLNALKHAFADGRPGTLTVTLQSGPEMHELFMQDDGHGLPENFSPAASTGIGIELMDSLTRQIRGHWAFVPSPVGTTVVVRWPVPQPSVFPAVAGASISSENLSTH